MIHLNLNVFFFNKGKADHARSLYDMVKHMDKCPYYVHRVKVPPSPDPLDLTQYILDVKKKGLFVVQLRTTCGISCHAVGINLEKKMIYDCQESNALPLSLKNLSHCCGPNLTFLKFESAAEITRNNQKKGR